MSARTWHWPAGPTLRPRYLAPISYPPISYPCPPCRARLGLQRFPCLGMALAIYSILITTVATLTNAFPQFPGHPNPLFDLHIPMLLEGQLAPNLGTVTACHPGIPSRCTTRFCVAASGGCGAACLQNSRRSAPVPGLSHVGFN